MLYLPDVAKKTMTIAPLPHSVDDPNVRTLATFNPMLLSAPLVLLRDNSILTKAKRSFARLSLTRNMLSYSFRMPANASCNSVQLTSPPTTSVTMEYLQGRFDMPMTLRTLTNCEGVTIGDVLDDWKAFCGCWAVMLTTGLSIRFARTVFPTQEELAKVKVAAGEMKKE